MQTCFIIMPITLPAEMLGLYAGDEDHFKHVLEHLFVPAIENIGFSPIAPQVTGADIIHAEIIRNLDTADLVLVDMSTLNPNVFFELGIRTAIDKPLSLVKDFYTTKVPFDAAPINHHSYDPSLTPWTLQQETRRLSDHLVKCINSRNSLWRYFGMTTRAEFPAPPTFEDKLDFLIRSLERVPDSSGVLRFNPVFRQEPLATEREVVKRAQIIASQIEAELSVLEMTPGKVVLNFEGYVIDELYKQQIIKLGADHEVEVVIQGGTGFNESIKASA